MRKRNCLIAVLVLHQLASADRVKASSNLCNTLYEIYLHTFGTALTALRIVANPFYARISNEMSLGVPQRTLVRDERLAVVAPFHRMATSAVLNLAQTQKQRLATVDLALGAMGFETPKYTKIYLNDRPLTMPLSQGSAGIQEQQLPGDRRLVHTILLQHSVLSEPAGYDSRWFYFMSERIRRMCF